MFCYKFNSLSHCVGLVLLCWLSCLFLWLRLASFPGSAHASRRIATVRNARQFVAHTPAHRLQMDRQFGAHTPAHTHTNRFYSFWAVLFLIFVITYLIFNSPPLGGRFLFFVFVVFVFVSFCFCFFLGQRIPPGAYLLAEMLDMP